MIPNIGPRGQARRRRFGFIMLAVAAVLATLWLLFDGSAGWRLLTFFPLWLSALGFFQAKDKT